MSENLIRSSQDFSKYDSMSIGELEEILRADAMGPERDDSDVDEILYVMEVLAKKRRQNGIAGKTALEAYQEFQQHYLPRPAAESKPSRKANIIPFKRIAAVAASLVLVFSLATSANALCFKDVWNAVVTWAQETFSFSMGVEISDATPSDIVPHSSFTEVLLEGNIPPSIIPAWIPDGYKLSEIIVDENPRQKTFVAIYISDTNMFKISVQSFLQERPERIERSDEFTELYSLGDSEYYLFTNNTTNSAVWIVDTYECYISGNLGIDEIKNMIASIQKG